MKSILPFLLLVLVAGCAHDPGPKYQGRGPAYASTRAPASGPRAYRIYATAGSYGLAWGCENQLVDFERMDYDEAYEESLLKTCKIQNFLLNTYEDRIVHDLQDDGYWVVRSHGMNHHSRGIERLGELTQGNATLYSLSEGAKWTSTETLFVSVLPESSGNPIEEKAHFCRTCTADAENAIVKALKWERKVTEHVSSMSFERRPGDQGKNLIVASYSADRPKSDTAKSYAARALFEIEFSANVLRLKFVKILNSSVN